MPSVVAVCDIRTLNVMKGNYPKYAKGEDKASGALWVDEETSMEDMVFLIDIFSEKTPLTVLRVFAHANPDEIILAKNPIDFLTASELGYLLRPRFAPGARLELHCCNVAADSTNFCQQLSNAAQVIVWSSPDAQNGRSVRYDGRKYVYRPQPKKK